MAMAGKLMPERMRHVDIEQNLHAVASMDFFANSSTICACARD